MHLPIQDYLAKPTIDDITRKISKLTRNIMENLSLVLLQDELRKGTLTFELSPGPAGDDLSIYACFEDGFDLGELRDTYNEAIRREDFITARECYLKSLNNPLTKASEDLWRYTYKGHST